MKKILFFNILFLIDLFVWIVLKLINGKLLILCLKNKFKISPKTSVGDLTRSRILINIKVFSSKKKNFTSCLSKAITVKILLDILNINNKIYFGISKNSNGKKIPHAWIVDPLSGEFITPGLYNQKSLIMYHF